MVDDLQFACNEAAVWARMGLPNAFDLAGLPADAFDYDIGRFVDATILATNYGKRQFSTAIPTISASGRQREFEQCFYF